MSAGLFGGDPMAWPLTYPGIVPPASGLLVGDCHLPLVEVFGESVGRWLVRAGGERVGLAGLLGDLGVAGMGLRRPVVAVGSNAAPSQLRRKFFGRSGRVVIPMTVADVRGIFAGVSGHISRWGYIPAAPVSSSVGSARLFVLWLDDEQLRVIDASEPNYHRRMLPADAYPVVLGGVVLPYCFVYVSKHGCLMDEAGVPRRLVGQNELMASVLRASPALRDLCGATPEEFVTAVANPGIREAAFQVLHAEGWVRGQPELSALRGA